MTNEYLLAILQLQRKHFVWSGRFIDSMFHYIILLSVDMIYHRVGKNFLWMSNNTVQGMQNLCIYTLSGIDSQSLERMDSVLRTNMKGETDRVCICTVACSIA